MKIRNTIDLLTLFEMKPRWADSTEEFKSDNLLIYLYINEDMTEFSLRVDFVDSFDRWGCVPFQRKYEHTEEGFKKAYKEISMMVCIKDRVVRYFSDIYGHEAKLEDDYLDIDFKVWDKLMEGELDE
jgi:hypothetical protein